MTMTNDPATAAHEGIRYVSVHQDSDSWIQQGDSKFSALFFGAPGRPDSPVAVFVKAGRDVGDKIAGARSHPTATLIAVIDGELELDGEWLKRGDLSFAKPGVTRGEMIIGPEGATFAIVFAERSGLIPTFTNVEDQQLFDRDLRDAIEAACTGEAEQPFALLPQRASHTPRRGVQFTDVEEIDNFNRDWKNRIPRIEGVHRTWITDDSLPWGPDIVNARSTLFVLGDAMNENAPTVGIINVFPGPGDRLRGMHIHHADAVNLIIEGAFYMDGRWLRPGEAKIVDANKAYGDGLVGPEGVRFLEIWSAQHGAEPIYTNDDDQAYYEAIKAKGHLVDRSEV